MMNQEIKARWVAWLRDNVENQGTGKLNKDGKFCCLGGLCELAVQDGIAAYTVKNGYGSYGAPGHDLWAQDVLPTVVYQWAGLDSENPEVLVDESDLEDPDSSIRNYDLTEVNDSLHLDFNRIADLIERQL